MDEKELAMEFYRVAGELADNHQAPRAAMAAAMLRAGIQVFVDELGPAAAAAWLARESESFQDAFHRAN